MSPREIASIVLDADENIYVYEVKYVDDNRNGAYRKVKGVIEIRSTSESARQFRIAILNRDTERLRASILGLCDERYFGMLREDERVFTIVNNEHFKDDANHLPPNLLKGGVSLVAVGNSNFPVVLR